MLEDSARLDFPDIVHLWNMYSDLLWEPGRHKETCMGYAYEIQDIVRRRGITAFDNSLVDAIRVECRRRGNKNSTINRKLSLLGKLLRKHHRDGHLNRLPDLKKFPERNGRIRFLTRDEEEAIFSALDAIDRHYGNLARFLINTGARVGEATSLRWSDIDGKTATFWETKAHTPRSVPLSRAAMDVLEQERERRAIGPFHAIRYANFRNAWNRARAAAGYSRDLQVVPHILRHTCASRLAQAGVDIKRIQEFLGHKTLAMTLRYAHLAPKHLQVCADVINEINDLSQAARQQRQAGALHECMV
jgi:integrase